MSDTNDIQMVATNQITVLPNEVDGWTLEDDTLSPTDDGYWSGRVEYEHKNGARAMAERRADGWNVTVCYPNVDSGLMETYPYGAVGGLESAMGYLRDILTGGEC